EDLITRRNIPLLPAPDGSGILRLVIRSSSALPVRGFLALMMWSGAEQNVQNRHHQKTALTR
ncbi:hypothetical protein ABI428_34300, partial [Pseudomonas aeruginosa]